MPPGGGSKRLGARGRVGTNPSFVAFLLSATISYERSETGGGGPQAAGNAPSISTRDRNRAPSDGQRPTI